jgi:hypothetical protein
MEFRAQVEFLVDKYLPRLKDGGARQAQQEGPVEVEEEEEEG